MKIKVSAFMVAAALAVIPASFSRVVVAEEIRMSEACEVLGQRLKEQLASPLYQKALERKKAGTLLPASRRRLEYVAMLREALKAAGCKGRK